MYYVYIVECKDGTLYTGWTINIQKRLALHNQGKGAKYTRARCPVVLRYREKFISPKEARQREYAIKRMPRAKKLALIAFAGEEETEAGTRPGSL